MPNMSYCRFFNTYLDYCDCVEALANSDLPKSANEKEYMHKLYEKSKVYILKYEKLKKTGEIQ